MMKLRSLSYLFPFVTDRIIQGLMALAALWAAAIGYIFWRNWDDIKGNPEFWKLYPETGLMIDGLVVLFVLTMLLMSRRYFKYYFDEFEEKKSQQMGFRAISILIGGAYLYSMVEYRFDLTPQPGWVWAVVINLVVFVCWLYSQLKYRS